MKRLSVEDRSCAEFISKVAEEVPGWSPADQLLALAVLAASSASIGGDVLELGVWYGRSTFVLGWIKNMLGGRIHALDIFPEKEDWIQNQDGSYSVLCERNGRSCGFGHDATVWRDAFDSSIAPIYKLHGSPWTYFNKNLAKLNLQDAVAPYRMSADQFYEEWEGRLSAHLAFIDGDHSYSAVLKDIAFAKRHLRPGGWICLDDAFTSYHGIDRAITEAILESPEFESAYKPTRKMLVARRV
jgi:predicted O-methyltransferase YrrM